MWVPFIDGGQPQGIAPTTVIFEFQLIQQRPKIHVGETIKIRLSQLEKRINCYPDLRHFRNVLMARL